MVNPFGKFGYTPKVKFKRREERYPPHVEAMLIAVCKEWKCQFLEDIIVMMIDLGCRIGELLKLTNAHVDWELHTVTFYETQKRKRADTGEPENRVVPFNPKGRVAKILKRRLFAGVTAFVIDIKGKSRYQIAQRGWQNLALHALAGIPRTRGLVLKEGTPEHEAYQKLNKWLEDFRHESITWMALKRVPKDVRDFITGHSSQTMDGIYNHSLAQLAVEELQEKVWPVEHLRATASQSSPNAVKTRKIASK
jgi:integrase